MTSISKFPTLYELVAEYREAAERLYDLDLPPQVVADTLESLRGPPEEKALNVAKVIRNMHATVSAMKVAEEQMRKRREFLENREFYLKDYLKYNLEAAGISSVDSPTLCIAIRRNPPAVVVDAASQVPERYWRQKPPPPPELDKVAIRDAIKSGEEVPGVHLEQSTRLDIG